MGIIAQIEAQDAGRIAVEVAGREVSFGRLVRDLNAAAAQFAGAGVDPACMAGVRAGSADNGHSYANWVAHLALMKLGAGHCSLTDLPAARAAIQAERIDVLIGPLDRLVDLPRGVRQVQFDCSPFAPEPAATDAPPNAEQSARRLNLTSGTTGKPRFVLWDAGLIERRVMQVAEDGLIGPGTIMFPVLHLRTTAGFRFPLACWALGGRVILPQAAKGIEREREALPRANFLFCSPPKLRERLAALPGEWPGRAGRTIHLLGGRLAPALREAALARACERLVISYGSTETGGIAIGDHALIDRHPGAVGMLRPGVAAEVVDGQGQPVAPGEAGQLRIRSPLMAKGYDGSGGADPASGEFRDGWFYPGDIARLFEDGLLAIEGRGSETLNLGGWKVAAGDLEAKAAGFAGVDDVCALAVPLPEGDLLTFAVVCGEDFPVERFRSAARSWVARGRPVSVVRVPSIPRNAMGKVPRAQLAEQLAAMHQSARKRTMGA